MHNSKECCTAITLPIRNAFNSACWPTLYKLYGLYRHRRILCVSLAAITGGLPQSSVLGPLLQNILYDGMLRLPIPGCVQIIGYVDDIAGTIVGKELQQIEATCVTTLARIKCWSKLLNL